MDSPTNGLITVLLIHSAQFVFSQLCWLTIVAERVSEWGRKRDLGRGVIEACAGSSQSGCRTPSGEVGGVEVAEGGFQLSWESRD